jgi:arylsulfatase A-like enzyme
MLGDHRLSHKVVFYQGALHIPCLIRPPQGISGRLSNALTDQLDVAATILDIAGAEPLEGSDGRSLVQNVSAPADSPDANKGKEAIFSEVVSYSMILTDRYKMVIDARERRPQELYDMANDPNEVHNLVTDPSLKKVREELIDKHLSRLLSRLDEKKLKAFEERRAKLVAGHRSWDTIEKRLAAMEDRR